MADLTQFDIQPSREDNWLGWAKSGQQPKGDESGKELGQTIGKAVDNVGKVGGELTKAYAESGARDILAEETGKLEGTANQLGVDQGLLGGARGQADDPNKAPQEVVNAKTTVENLGSSKANGAMSNTYYLGRLLQFQKDTRAQFPFFKEQFDAGVKEATGVAHTANEYHRDLLADINSFLTAKDTSKNSLITELKSKGVMGGTYQGLNSADWINGVTDGSRSIADGWRWVNGIQAHQWENDRKLTDINVRQKEAEDIITQATPNAQQVAYNAVNEYNMTFKNQMGLKSNEDILSAIAGKQSPQEQRMWTEKYALHLQNLENEVDQRLRYQPKDKAGNLIIDPNTKLPYKSWAQLIGPQKIAEIKAEAKKAGQDGLTYMANGQYGVLAHFANVRQAVQEARLTDIDRTELGNIDGIMRAFKDAPPMLQDFVQTELKKGLLPSTSAVVQTLKAKSYYNDQSTLNQNSPGAKLTSLNDDVAFVTKQFGKSPGVIKDLVDDVGRTLNSPVATDAMKIAKVKYAMSNMDTDGVQRSMFMRQWNRDSRPEALNSIFSASNIAAVKKLDDLHPGLNLFDHMKSSAQTTLRDMIGVEVRDLSQLQSPEGRGTYKVDYDNTAHEFKVTDSTAFSGAYGDSPLAAPFKTGAQAIERGSAGAAFPGGTLGSAQNLVDRVNRGLRVVNNIAQVDGQTNPNSYIYETLRQMGYSPSNETLVGSMMNAVRSSYQDLESNYRKGLEKLKEVVKPKKESQ